MQFFADCDGLRAPPRICAHHAGACSGRRGGHSPRFLADRLTMSSHLGGGRLGLGPQLARNADRVWGRLVCSFELACGNACARVLRRLLDGAAPLARCFGGASHGRGLDAVMYRAALGQALVVYVAVGSLDQVCLDGRSASRTLFGGFPLAEISGLQRLQPSWR